MITMIITNNEEILRTPCEDVLPEEVGELISTLESELAHANKLGKSGIGLAAPQIGIFKKIAIIRLSKNTDSHINLINCKIKNGYYPAIFKDEGCLSFPGKVENTTRFQEIHVVDNLQYPYSFIATGLLAVACQHEIDHYSSKLFMDYKIITKSKVGPNNLCPCGSNFKFKKCCGKNV